MNINYQPYIKPPSNPKKFEQYSPQFQKAIVNHDLFRLNKTRNNSSHELKTGEKMEDSIKREERAISNQIDKKNDGKTKEEIVFYKNTKSSKSEGDLGNVAATHGQNWAGMIGKKEEGKEDAGKRILNFIPLRKQVFLEKDEMSKPSTLYFEPLHYKKYTANQSITLDKVLTKQPRKKTLFGDWDKTIKKNERYNFFKKEDLEKKNFGIIPNNNKTNVIF
jgi:hypothetical protein